MSLVTLCVQLDALSECSFLLKDPTGGKKILDLIQETTPFIDLHNDVPLGGERIEQPRLLSAGFELSSRLYLNSVEGTFPEQQESWGKSVSCKYYHLDSLTVLSS